VGGDYLFLHSLPKFVLRGIWHVLAAWEVAELVEAATLWETEVQLLEELAWMFWLQERGFGSSPPGRREIVRMPLQKASSVNSFHLSDQIAARWLVYVLIALML
jgi:hypothetical protein